MKALFVNPQSPPYYEGLTPDQISLMKKTVNGSKTLQRRLEFSEKAFSGLGLLTAAAVAKRFDPEMKIDFLDENMESSDLDDRLDEGYDLVAVGGTVHQMNRMLSVIRAARRKGIPVSVGGAAVNTFPDAFKKNGVGVLLGESETVFPRYLEALNQGVQESVYEPSSSSGFDLKDSPVPDYFSISGYDYAFIGVQTTRGCPFRCEFCQVFPMDGNAIPAQGPGTNRTRDQNREIRPARCVFLFL